MVNMNLATLLETGVITYEYRWRVADGSYKWFYDISKLMKSPSGETSYIIGTWVDITERKKAEEKLQESERKYKSLFEDAGDALFIMDVSEEHGVRFLECNDRTLKLFGCTRRDQIIGKTPVDFSPPKQPDGQPSFEKAREIASDVIKGHPRCFEWAHYRLNGTPFWVEVTLNRIEFKGEFIMQAVVRDITERKQLENALKKSSFYLENVSDTLIAINSEREIIKVNKEFSKLWGYSAEEVLGKSVFMIFPEEEIAKHKSEMEKAISSKEPRNFETVALTKSGERMPLSIRGSVVFDKNEELGGFIGIFRDITERKKEGEELKRHRDHLQELVKEQTTELTKTNEQLQLQIAEHELAEEKKAKLLKEVERINQELRDFVYIASHHLKTPLRAINTLANWIFTDYTDKLDKAGKDQLELLVSRVNRMYALIDGILEYSKFERISKVKVNINKIVTEVIDMIAPPKNIKITVENKLPSILCEKTHIVEIFQNLLSNAINYMDKPEGIIKIGCVEDNGYWKFSVSDNGPGIDERYFEKIFQIFQILSAIDEQESTGLGLALVKKIVNMYKGKVWVESKVGHGSTFFFMLPKEQKQDPTPRNNTPQTG
jgi:PAS domain S-box-containing protein